MTVQITPDNENKDGDGILGAYFIVSLLMTD